MKDFFAACAAVLAVSTAAWQLPASAQPQSATQSSAARGVTVKVTPGRLTATEWEFSVVLDTHSEALKDDLERSAVLVANGREWLPLGWQGPAADGHHREGVLRFPAAGGGAGPVELRLSRPGEATARVFRWEALPQQ